MTGAGTIFTSRVPGYRDFVRGGIRVESPWDKLRGQVSLGVDDFVDRLKPYLKESEELTQDVAAQDLADRPGLGGVAGIQDKPQQVHDRLIRETYEKHG